MSLLGGDMTTREIIPAEGRVLHPMQPGRYGSAIALLRQGERLCVRIWDGLSTWVSQVDKGAELEKILAAQKEGQLLEVELLAVDFNEHHPSPR